MRARSLGVIEFRNCHYLMVESALETELDAGSLPAQRFHRLAAEAGEMDGRLGNFTLTTSRISID